MLFSGAQSFEKKSLICQSHIFGPIKNCYFLTAQTDKYWCAKLVKTGFIDLYFDLMTHQILKVK